MCERHARLTHPEGYLHFIPADRMRRAEHLQHLLTMRLDVAHPDTTRERMYLQQAEATLARAMRDMLSRTQECLTYQHADLELLTPQRTLGRGCVALLDDKGHAIRDPNILHARTHIEARLAQDTADIEIVRVRPELEL